MRHFFNYEKGSPGKAFARAKARRDRRRSGEVALARGRPRIDGQAQGEPTARSPAPRRLPERTFPFGSTPALPNLPLFSSFASTWGHVDATHLDGSDGLLLLWGLDLDDRLLLAVHGHGASHLVSSSRSPTNALSLLITLFLSLPLPPTPAFDLMPGWHLLMIFPETLGSIRSHGSPCSAPLMPPLDDHTQHSRDDGEDGEHDDDEAGEEGGEDGRHGVRFAPRHPLPVLVRRRGRGPEDLPRRSAPLRCD